MDHQSSAPAIVALQPSHVGPNEIMRGTMTEVGRAQNSINHVNAFPVQQFFQQVNLAADQSPPNGEFSFAFPWNPNSFSRYGQREELTFESIPNQPLTTNDFIGPDSHIHQRSQPGCCVTQPSVPLAPINQEYEDGSSLFPFTLPDAEPDLTDDVATPENANHEQVQGNGNDCKKRSAEHDESPRKRRSSKSNSASGSSSDQSTPQQTDAVSKRTRHDIVERRYRERMNLAIADLGSAVPSMRENEGEMRNGPQGPSRGVKLFKVPILKGAKGYIMELEEQLAVLKRQHCFLLAQLEIFHAALSQMPAPVPVPFTGKWYEFGVDDANGIKFEDFVNIDAA